MTYALVIVEGPVLDAGHDTELQWTAFVRVTENIVKPKAGIERLGQNAWLIPLSSDMQALCALVEASRKHRFACRTMFLDHKPSFNLS